LPTVSLKAQSSRPQLHC